MKKTSLLLCLCLFVGQSFISSCTSEPKKEIDVIVNIQDIAGKTPPEVQLVLGKAKSQEKVIGYPCKNADCTREYFQNGKFEVIFKEGKADRITINQAPDLTETDNAITALGLPDSAPSFANPKTVMRWEGVEGLYEVGFFTDYVLVQVNRPE